MKTNLHDTLVYRLAQMLVKLNQGEKLDPRTLADEFGVNLRTIQRDLNERFTYLPLLKQEGRYLLNPLFLGKLNTKDIERFATLAGVQGLFPSLSAEFLRDIFETATESPLLIKGHHYEDMAGQEQKFKELEQAILNRYVVTFDYQRSDYNKRYEAIEPYKLINHKGIWYLAGKDGEKVKTFSFTKISSLINQEITFQHEPSIEQSLIRDDSIWFCKERKEIVLKIAKEAAVYFKRRKLIANQVIDKELEDGGLLVSVKVGHPNEVLAIVRYWIPHIRIISPESLKNDMLTEIKDYLIS